MKFPLAALMLSLFALSLLMTGCVRDKCDMNYTYYRYTPEYLSEADFLDAVAVESPQAIQEPGKIFLQENLLLVNEVGRGVHLIDNTNPASPQPLSFLKVPGNYDLYVHCGQLYLDSSSDLLVFDLSDPARPKLTQRLRNALPVMSSYRGYTADPSKGVVVRWHQEVVQEPYDCQGGVPAVWEMNQVDPNSQDFTNLGPTTRGVNPAVSGKGGSMSRFTVSQDHLYIVLPQQLKTYDVTNCGSPTPVGEQPLNLWGAEAEMISTLNDLLLIGSTNSVFIYGTENPAQPNLLSTFDHVASCDPVVGQGNFAYVTLRNGPDQPCGQEFSNQLDILDISSPRNPTLLRTFPMTNPHGLSIDGDRLFIADGEAGLRMFDASEPAKTGDRQLAQAAGMHGYDVIAHEGLLIFTGKDGIAQYDYRNGELTQLSVLPVE